MKAGPATGADGDCRLKLCAAREGKPVAQSTRAGTPQRRAAPLPLSHFGKLPALPEDSDWEARRRRSSEGSLGEAKEELLPNHKTKRAACDNTGRPRVSHLTVTQSA